MFPRGRARISARHPQATAICDNCSFRYNHVDLREEMQWQGNSVKKTGFLVCYICFDKAQPQLSSPILPADPYPIRNPRPELYRGDLGFELASSGDLISEALPVTGLP